jgi:hypothetical protein
MVEHSCQFSMNIVSTSCVRIHTPALSAEHTFVVPLSLIGHYSTVRTCMKQCIPSYEVSSLEEPSGSELTMTTIDNEMC